MQKTIGRALLGKGALPLFFVLSRLMAAWVAWGYYLKFRIQPAFAKSET